jgi:hypothetical protein
MDGRQGPAVGCVSRDAAPGRAGCDKKVPGVAPARLSQAIWTADRSLTVDWAISNGGWSSLEPVEAHDYGRVLLRGRSTPSAVDTFIRSGRFAPSCQHLVSKHHRLVKQRALFGSDDPGRFRRRRSQSQRPRGKDGDRYAKGTAAARTGPRNLRLLDLKIGFLGLEKQKRSPKLDAGLARDGGWPGPAATALAPIASLLTSCSLSRAHPRQGN